MYGRNIYIRIDKTSCIGIIIAGIEVIKSCFSIEIVASIADWVNFTDAGGVIGNGAFAPGVVEIFGNNVSILVENGCYIALEIFEVEIIRCCIIFSGKIMISKATDARSIIEIDKACTVSAFLYQLIAIIKITSIILCYSISIRIIAKCCVINFFK